MSERGSANARIGEQLIEAGLLTQAALQAALDFQRDAGGYLTDVLVLNGHISEAALLRFLAQQAKVRFITAEKMSKAKFEPTMLDRLPVRQAERLCAVPLAFDEGSGTLTLALPEASTDLLEQAANAVRADSILPILALRVAIRAGIQRFYYGDLYAFAALDSEVSTLKVVPEAPASSPAPQASTSPPVPVEDTVVRSAAWPASTNAVPTETARFAQPGSAASLEREIKALRAARDLGVHLAFERSLPSLLHRALAFTFDTLPADDGAIVRVDEVTGKYVPEALRSRAGEASEVVVSRALVDRVISGPEVVLTIDAVGDPRFSGSESIARAQIRSAMGVPLIERGRPPGAIVLSNRGLGTVFNDASLEVLSAIAAQTSRSIEGAKFNRRLDDNAATRVRLARHFPPALVEMGLTGEYPLDEAGELREAAILVVQLKDFGQVTERLAPREVIALLNEQVEALVDVIFARGGALDRYLGDGLVGVWGIGPKQGDVAGRALEAALDAMARVTQINERRAEQGEASAPVGVGVDYGTVVFGSVGTSRRMDLAAIGEPVTLATRLCQASKPWEILASPAAISAATGSFETRNGPMIALKTKKEGMKSVTVLGHGSKARGR